MLLAMAACAAANSAQAVEITREGSFRFTAPALVAADTICQKKAASHLDKFAKGLEKIDFPGPDYWDSAITGNTAFLYSGLTIKSMSGEVEANMLCLLSTSANPTVETAFSFLGEGLVGRKERYRVGGVSGEVPAFSFVSSSPLQK
ncbi:hypothetical protein [Cribrihabitans neustonicus]|uniref:hypothetical protein n=1 Tax=Cribrihabitans neustonicus TaxID=1429085 RepID=UPI003B5CDEE6